jgi:hypothetical protein
VTTAEETSQILDLFGIESAGKLVSFSPIDGKSIGRVPVCDPDAICARAADSFLRWRTVPAPRRG